MEVLRIILMVIDILICLGVIAAVLMQSSRSAGISGTIGGASEQIFGKKKGLDDFLAKISGILTAAFFVITLILTLIF
ncbi:MAG TPA: preprotein translocase subunit SecG [Firmicutes bacterium]|nr:preprotein translocase subunit SecG [Bacillota bacterium]